MTTIRLGSALAAVIGCSLLLGCDPIEEKRAKQVAQARADAEGPQAGTRRCGDFLSEAEAQELGLEGYRAGKGDKNPLRGLVCAVHPVVVTVFMAEQFPTMLAGAKRLKGLKERTGPPLGKEAFWFEALEVEQVMFVSSSGNYAFGVSGEDKTLVEKAAKMVGEGR